MTKILGATFMSAVVSMASIQTVTAQPINVPETLIYESCVSKSQSLPCDIAFSKLKTIKNPINGKNYFDDGVHFINGSLFLYPTLWVATPDLDNDGFKEIIVTVPEVFEELEGVFCKEGIQCPHYILQDRGNGKLEDYKILGPIFAYSVGLSTDERFSNYLSLRAYKDKNFSQFDVYQYDSLEDQYFNMSLK